VRIKKEVGRRKVRWRRGGMEGDEARIFRGRAPGRSLH
jgi:hypothetical protein